MDRRRRAFIYVSIYIDICYVYRGLNMVQWGGLDGFVGTDVRLVARAVDDVETSRSLVRLCGK